MNSQFPITSGRKESGVYIYIFKISEYCIFLIHNSRQQFHYWIEKYRFIIVKYRKIIRNVEVCLGFRYSSNIPSFVWILKWWDGWVKCMSKSHSTSVISSSSRDQKSDIITIWTCRVWNPGPTFPEFTLHHKTELLEKCENRIF